MPKERKLREVFKTPWGKLKVIENKLIILNITSKRTNNLPRKNNEELC